MKAALRRARLAAPVMLVLFVACTSTSPERSSHPSRPRISRPSTSPGGRFLSGPCPVTQPAAAKDVPRSVVHAVEPGTQVPLGIHDFDYWYGNAALWVELPPGGTVVKPMTEKLSEKFPWVRLVRGYLRIDGRRLDGPASPAAGIASNGYGLIGFQASGVAFPTPGCWELTGGSPGRSSPSSWRRATRPASAPLL
jgi:hypothetical protein